MNSSSYDQLDFLQTTRPFNYSLTNPLLPPVQSSASSKKTKFGSVLDDLSSFLTTAADTAVTVDGIINGGKPQSGGHSLTPEQQMALMQSQKSGGNMTSFLLIGGVVVVGGAVMYTLLKKKS
ncbi:hypothetical protein NC796_02505 [Aliifodinibius sp. S!AR15-10]|uniref:hypothetical protein n=1 Tax=Aliifodinibius sp. S!AR15-10 TaxID=2950437 RepID=UPI002866E875|nr:hypothetical protein [Aliifodinibius sp. S!AR15-10]MDR8389993.1 hypothetical protein [Aliifodinibius sp. S!AR15-10]